jgi:hypothetical protein
MDELIPWGFLRACLSSVVRHAMTAFAGYLLASGMIQANAQDQIVACGVGLFTLLWSWGQKLGRDGAVKTLRSIADALDKQKISAQPALKGSTP